MLLFVLLRKRKANECYDGITISSAIVEFVLCVLVSLMVQPASVSMSLSTEVPRLFSNNLLKR